MDGLYSTDRIVTPIDGKQHDASYGYLRFYPDGAVVKASIHVEPNEQPDLKHLATWLTDANPYILRGAYAVSGSTITFKVASSEGVIDNVASLGEGRISNHWRSSINGREGDDEYRFIPLPKALLSTGSAFVPGLTLCASQEITVWSCQAGREIYSVCASADLGADSGYMQYRAGTSTGATFVYPQQLDHPRQHFVFELGPHGAGLDFKDGEYTYHIGDELKGMPIIFVMRENEEDELEIECSDASKSLTETSTIDLMSAAGIAE